MSDAVLIAIIGGSLFLGSLIAKPLYLRMASYSEEFDKRRAPGAFGLSSFALKQIKDVIVLPPGVGEDEAGKILDRLSLLNEGPQSIQEAQGQLAQYFPSHTWEIGDAKDHSAVLALLKENGSLKLCFVQKSFFGHHGYSPKHEPGKNRKLPPLLSFCAKELRTIGRDYRSVIGIYLLFIVPPLATLVLNTVFESMRKSFTGELLTVIFNALIISLILLASSVSVASIYSREGKAVQQTISAPQDLRYILTSKLLLRFLLMTGSIIFTIVVYSMHCSIAYVRMDILFFCFYFLYLGHLLWSAELDYFNPMPHLYTTASGGATINKNEALSALFAILFSVLFTLLTLLFVQESIIEGFYRLLIFSTIFLVARIALFFLKIRAYGALPFEGRGDR